MIEFVLAATIAWVDTDGQRHERLIQDGPFRSHSACVRALTGYMKPYADSNQGVLPSVIGGQACEAKESATTTKKRTKKEQAEFDKGYAEAMAAAEAAAKAPKPASAPGR
jgi:TctA family transporter